MTTMDLLKKVKSIPAAGGKIITKAVNKITGFGKSLNIPEKIRRLINKITQLTSKLFPGKKAHLIIGGFAAVILLALLSVVVVMMNVTGGRQHMDSEMISSQRIIIPEQEIFLSDEPDFVPGIMLERERRTMWTVEDASPFWQDPLMNGEEQWRGHIETLIDELMERVP